MGCAVFERVFHFFGLSSMFTLSCSISVFQHFSCLSLCPLVFARLSLLLSSVPLRPYKRIPHLKHCSYRHIYFPLLSLSIQWDKTTHFLLLATLVDPSSLNFSFNTNINIHFLFSLSNNQVTESPVRKIRGAGHFEKKLTNRGFDWFDSTFQTLTLKNIHSKTNGISGTTVVSWARPRRARHPNVEPAGLPAQDAGPTCLHHRSQRASRLADRKSVV